MIDGDPGCLHFSAQELAGSQHATSPATVPAVCVGPSVCTSFGTTVSELSSANVALMGLDACGLATACVFELLRRFTAVFAEIGPSGVLASLAFVAATWGRPDRPQISTSQYLILCWSGYATSLAGFATSGSVLTGP